MITASPSRVPARGAAPTRFPSASRASGLALLAGLLAVASAASLALGSRDIPLRDVADALFAFDGSAHDLIVRDLRVPRTILGIAVGAALGAAGALMQGLTRNPLADPGILGVNAGASLAVVGSISLLGITDLRIHSWFAIGGAGLAAVAVYALGAGSRGRATPVRLALAGAALSALLASFTTTLLLLDEAALDQFRFWVVGSVAGRNPSTTARVGPFLVAGALLGLASARALNTLALGDDLARALGQRLGFARAAVAAAVVLLVGGAVAAAGPIGFVGLTVPHAARSITGPDHRWLLPYSAILGATLVVTADVLGRIAARPGEVQVGIVTALIGAPFFMVLVRRRQVAAL